MELVIFEFILLVIISITTGIFILLFFVSSLKNSLKLLFQWIIIALGTACMYVLWSTWIQNGGLERLPATWKAFINTQFVLLKEHKTASWWGF